MRYRGHRLSANVSLLFAELPYIDRFAAAREAGFELVESWWPFAVPDPDPDLVDAFVTAIDKADVSLSALNFFAGDMAAGQRGLACVPDRQDELAANVEVVVRIAERTGCRQFNLLYGQLDDRWSRAEQEDTAVAAISSAAAAVAAVGGTVLLEPLSKGLNGAYPLLTADDVGALLGGPLRQVPNVSLLFDTFHLGNNGTDLVAAASELGGGLAHVQIADSPGRGEPGTGRLPLDATLDALRRAGYGGVVACEYRPVAETAAGLVWTRR